MSLDLDPQRPAARSRSAMPAAIARAIVRVFPAITRERAFADGDITQLANLCHNCRGCYYACQYTEPHEFALNLPAASGRGPRRQLGPSGLARRLRGPVPAQRRGHRGGPCRWPSARSLFAAQALAACQRRRLLRRPVPRHDGRDLRARVSAAAAGHCDLDARLLARRRRDADHLGAPESGAWRRGEPEEPWRRSGSGLQFRGRGPLFQRTPLGASGGAVGLPVVLRLDLVRHGPALCLRSAGALRVLFACPNCWAFPAAAAGRRLRGAGLAEDQGRPRAGRAECLGRRDGVRRSCWAPPARPACCCMPRPAPPRCRCCWRCIWAAVLAFFLLTPYSKMVHGFYRFAALIRDAQIRGQA